MAYDGRAYMSDEQTQIEGDEFGRCAGMVVLCNKSSNAKVSEKTFFTVSIFFQFRGLGGVNSAIMSTT